MAWQSCASRCGPGLPCTGQSSSAQTLNQILSKVWCCAWRADSHPCAPIGTCFGDDFIYVSKLPGPFTVELKRPMKMHMTLGGSKNQTMIRVYSTTLEGWANNPFAGKLNPEGNAEED